MAIMSHGYSEMGVLLLSIMVRVLYRSGEVESVSFTYWHICVLPQKRCNSDEKIYTSRYVVALYSVQPWVAARLRWHNYNFIF